MSMSSTKLLQSALAPITKQSRDEQSVDKKLPTAKKGPGFFDGKGIGYREKMAESDVWESKLDPGGKKLVWTKTTRPELIRVIDPETRRKVKAHFNSENDNFDEVFVRALNPVYDAKEGTAVVEIGAGFNLNASIFRERLGNTTVLACDINAKMLAVAQLWHQDQAWYHPVCADVRNLSALEHFLAIRHCKIPCLFVSRHQEAYFKAWQWIPAIDSVVKAMLPGEKFLVTSYTQHEAEIFKILIEGRLKLLSESWWPALTAPEQHPGSFSDGHAMVFVKPHAPKKV